jgi:LCP family protein required for cell wall assembly
VRSADIKPATSKLVKKPATKPVAKPVVKQTARPAMHQSAMRRPLTRTVNRSIKPTHKPEAISNPAQKTTTKKPVVRAKVLDDFDDNDDALQEIERLEKSLDKKHPEKQRKHEGRRYPFFDIIRWPIILAEIVTSVLMYIAIRRLNVFQAWQFALAIGIVAIILLYTVYILFFKRRAKIFGRIFACILAALICTTNIAAYIYANQAADFIKSIAGISQEMQFYEVRVLKSAKLTKLEHLAKQKIGFLKSNPNLEETKKGLKESLKDFEAVEYEEVGSLLAALYDKEIGAVVVNESYLGFLEDAESNFEEDTINIHDIRVKAGKDLDLRQPVAVTKEPFAVYISGSDARGAITQTARSDVNIVAIINPAKGKILTISIPRDYYVRLHGTTGNLDNLTHAGVYGIEMSKNTVADLLDVKINYTVKVGFQAVQRLVDAVDGIDIESDQELHISQEKFGRCDIAKGMNHLNGACALRYARERKSYATGDRHRGQNQQQVLSAIITKLSDKHYTARYSKILDAAKGTFQTSFTDEEIKDFARWQLAELKHWTTENIQLDGTGSMQPTYSMGSMKLYVMIPDQNTIVAAKQKIAEYLQK